MPALGSGTAGKLRVCVPLGLPGQEVQQLPSVARSCPQGAFVRAGKFDLTERALVTYCLGTWCTDGRPPRIVTVALTVLAGNFALKRRGVPSVPATRWSLSLVDGGRAEGFPQRVGPGGPCSADRQLVGCRNAAEAIGATNRVADNI